MGDVLAIRVTAAHAETAENRPKVISDQPPILPCPLRHEQPAIGALPPFQAPAVARRPLPARPLGSARNWRPWWFAVRLPGSCNVRT